MKEQNRESAPNRVAWNEELRGWLEGYVKRYPHHTTDVLSRSQYIGVSRRALDAYIAGTYFLPKKDGARDRTRRLRQSRTRSASTASASKGPSVTATPTRSSGRARGSRSGRRATW